MYLVGSYTESVMRFGIALYYFTCPPTRTVSLYLVVTTVTPYPVGPRIQSQTSVTQLEGIGPNQMRCRRRKEEEKDRREEEGYLYLVTGDFPKRTTTHVRLCIYFTAPRSSSTITNSTDQP